MEPKYPTAVDRYVDLGRFYDLTAVKAQADEVKQHTRNYKGAYARAYRCFRAAREVELDTVAEVRQTFDAQRAARRFSGIMTRELKGRGSGTGRVIRRILGSVTHKGPVWRFDSVDALCPKVYVLEDRHELAGPLLKVLRDEAARRDHDVIVCVAPEDPDRPEHLLIPELGLAFVTSRPGMEYPGKPSRRVRLDAMVRPENRGRLRFQMRMANALRDEGIAALSEAKAAHDRLEAVYNPYVDFEGVRAQAALEAGRLLSWMK